MRFSGLTLLTLMGLLAIMSSFNTAAHSENPEEQRRAVCSKIALNAYSFNAYLKADSMDLFDLLDYSAGLGFDGVDLTGYYFPGYPDPPSDEYIYRIKKRAFELGLHICGTGVRNDFCYADPEMRAKEKAHVKDWILVAEKLGAPAIRIFTGKNIPEGYSWEEISAWVAEDILECAAFGKQHGVVIEIQNHNDFLKTADEVIKLMEMIDSEWVGLMLDIGSYRTSDPYVEIEQTIPYAISWQIKEKVYINQEQTPVDLARLARIIAHSDYKGYLPIETLGPGDPFKKVDTFYTQVRRAFN